MPGDIRSEEYGMFPYYYENLFDHHPAQDSMNLGCADAWKKDESNEQVRRVIQNVRKQYEDSDRDLI